MPDFQKVIGARLSITFCGFLSNGHLVYYCMRLVNYLLSSCLGVVRKDDRFLFAGVPHVTGDGHQVDVPF